MSLVSQTVFYGLRKALKGTLRCLSRTISQAFYVLIENIKKKERVLSKTIHQFCNSLTKDVDKVLIRSANSIRVLSETVQWLYSLTKTVDKVLQDYLKGNWFDLKDRPSKTSRGPVDGDGVCKYCTSTVPSAPYLSPSKRKGRTSQTCFLLF